MKKLECVRKHRMVEVVPTLYLCECSSYGVLASRKGAAEEARAMIEKRYGTIDNLRRKLEDEEIERKKARDLARFDRAKRDRDAIRQD